MLDCAPLLDLYAAGGIAAGSASTAAESRLLEKRFLAPNQLRKPAAPDLGDVAYDPSRQIDEVQGVIEGLPRPPRVSALSWGTAISLFASDLRESVTVRAQLDRGWRVAAAVSEEFVTAVLISACREYLPAAVAQLEERRRQLVETVEDDLLEDPDGEYRELGEALQTTDPVDHSDEGALDAVSPNDQTDPPSSAPRPSRGRRGVEEDLPGFADPPGELPQSARDGFVRPAPRARQPIILRPNPNTP